MTDRLSYCESGAVCRSPFICARSGCGMNDLKPFTQKERDDRAARVASAGLGEWAVYKSPPTRDNAAAVSTAWLNAETRRNESVLSGPVHSGEGASGILTEAAGVVAGVRNVTHGDKERSFQVIADLWNAYLNGRKTDGNLTPFDVAQFMVLLKIGRSIQGTPARDHFVDAAGYSAIAGELGVKA